LKRLGFPSSARPVPMAGGATQRRAQRAGWNFASPNRLQEHASFHIVKSVAPLATQNASKPRSLFFQLFKSLFGLIASFLVSNTVCRLYLVALAQTIHTV